jgi:hypothetical protein
VELGRHLGGVGLQGGQFARQRRRERQHDEDADKPIDQIAPASGGSQDRRAFRLRAAD